MAETAQVSTPIIFQPQKSPVQMVVGAVIVGGAVYLGYNFIKNKINQSKANSQEDKAGNDIPTQQAITLHNAIDTWFGGKDTIFKVAKEIKDWEEVTKAYRNKFPNDKPLTDALNSKLSPEEQENFFSIINLSPAKSKTPGALPQNVKLKFNKGDLFIAASDTNIRKTPAYKGTNTLWHEKGNVIKLAKKGYILGHATGRFELDAEAKPPVLFYEIEVHNKDNIKKSFTTWAAASKLEVLPAKDFVNNLKAGKTYLYEAISPADYENAEQ